MVAEVGKSVLYRVIKHFKTGINAMSDNKIGTSDIPPLINEFSSKAKLRMPSFSLATVCYEFSFSIESRD